MRILIKSLQNIYAISSKSGSLPNYIWRNSAGNFFFFSECFQNFWCIFSSSNTLWLVRLTWNEKLVHRFDTGWTMWPWPLTSSMNLTFDFSRSIAACQEVLVRLMWTERKWINRYLTDYMALSFGDVHDLDPEFAMSKFEIAFLRNGRAERHKYERDVSLPFMTMTLTCVWPRSGGCMYQIVSGVTLDVGVPSTYLVLFIINCGMIQVILPYYHNTLASKI